MRCSVARLCERTVGRRVPPLWAGGGLLHTTPHCVVVTASGAELASCTSHTERRLVPSGAELRRYGKPHCSLRQGRERAEHFGGGQRCGAASFAKRWSCGWACCLLRHESSALPMTAKLRLRRGGEQRRRPERRCQLFTVTNDTHGLAALCWETQVCSSCHLATIAALLAAYLAFKAGRPPPAVS